ncbi:MAG: hypothetical protein GOMPHAMPRED_001879 [Gomphillus americanus]|uniref:Uncharacterized protein n=1 Tax=Gomphillus americanus TaxID=1940652 RepID=A0A8H3FA41_9LECA|nr:MAG: hypothetical protein GOMPHAMPRED_001879 [Gomphillus americanus]
MPSPTNETNGKVTETTSIAANETATKLDEAGDSRREEGLHTTTGSSNGASKLSKEEADQLYEERIEEEYAKREGGA